MPRFKQLEPIVKNLHKGKLISSKDLRTKVEALQVTSLRLNLQELKQLEAIVNSKIAATDIHHSAKAKFKSIKSILPGSGEEVGGFVETKPTTWKTISNIGDLINKSATDGFDIGHLHISSMGARIEYIKRQFKDEGGGLPTTEQIALANTMIALANKIDNLETRFLLPYKNRTDLNTDDLLKILAAVQAEGQNIVISDITATSKFVKGLEAGKGAKQIVIFEESSYNQAKGQLLGILGRAFSSLFKQADKAVEHELFETLTAASEQIEWELVRTSPSFYEKIEEELDAAFFDRESKNRISKKKVREVKTQNINTAEIKKLRALIATRTKKLKTKIEAQRKKKKFIIPTITLKAIINESLAEFIKNRMGKSSDPAIRLRYQSGRFSESAVLLTLNRTEAGTLLGTYDFMKNPYGTFLPGGRLHTQQRDPQIYIESAIRDIAIIVLKKQFNGIALELK
jgi:hypothetical protein